MRIASWNVNSAKARQDHILNYLRAGSCDVLLIQETKTCLLYTSPSPRDH